MFSTSSQLSIGRPLSHMETIRFRRKSSKLNDLKVNLDKQRNVLKTFDFKVLVKMRSYLLASKYVKVNQLKVEFPELSFLNKANCIVLDSIIEQKKGVLPFIQSLNADHFLRLYHVLYEKDDASLLLFKNEFSKLKSVLFSDLPVCDYILDSFFSDSFRLDILSKLKACQFNDLIFDFDHTLTTMHSNDIFKTGDIFATSSLITREKEIPKSFILLDTVKFLFWLRKEGFNVSIVSRQNSGIVRAILAEFHLDGFPIFAGSNEKNKRIASMTQQSLWIDDSPRITIDELMGVPSGSVLYNKFCLMKVSKNKLTPDYFLNLLDPLQLIIPLKKCNATSLTLRE